MTYQITTELALKLVLIKVVIIAIAIFLAWEISRTVKQSIVAVFTGLQCLNVIAISYMETRKQTNK